MNNLNYTRTEPCVECPFLLDGLSGCLTGKELLGIVSLGAAGHWPCHMSRRKPPGQRCAGMLLYAQHVGARIVNENQDAIDQANRVTGTVFDTEAEFLAAYNERLCPNHGIPSGQHQNGMRFLQPPKGVKATKTK